MSIIDVLRKVAFSLPIRYFVINPNTNIMHIHGFCQQTKPRIVPIRLFDTPEDLEHYAGRKLCLCKACQKELDRQK